MNAETYQDSSVVMSPADLAATLQSVQVDGYLDDLLLRIKTRHYYKNTGLNNLEAVYTFPLPWGATLLGLNAEIDGHCLKGAVLEKHQATQRYEKAIDEGDTPVMVERSALGLCTANLGNLKPGEEAVVEIEYAQLLHFEQGQIRITIPTTVAPRYGYARQTGGLAAHESVSTSVLVQYPFNVNITLAGKVAQAVIQCPSHTVVMAHNEDEIQVTLSQGGYLDRDFVLLLQNLQGQSFASVAPDGDGFAILASFCPTLPDHVPEPVLMKVLVDCSGSMIGDSISAARQALHEVMKEMTEADWISYSRFGSSVQHDLTALQPFTDNTIQQVAKLVDGTYANLGGTEMHAALISTFELGVSQDIKAIYTKSENQNNSKDVLLITDGDIWNVEAIIQLARQSGHRIFAIGVGSAPAESLLRELAEQSGGACELVSPNQDVAEVIVRMFRRMRSTRCTDIKVDWGQTPLWQSTMPTTLYGGDTLHLRARLPTKPEFAPKLTWVVNASPMQDSTALLQSQISDLLPRLVASQQIAQLKSFEKNNKQALELALNYQLVTAQTNLILVHVREEDKKAVGLPELSKVNHMLAAGWGGVGRVDAQVNYSVPAYCLNLSRGNRRVSASENTIEIPAYLIKTDSDSTDAFKSPAVTAVVSTVTLLKTFEATSQKVFAPFRFVRDLEANTLPEELTDSLQALSILLGTRGKAWAVVLLWMAEHLSKQITLSRQAERLLRQVLKDVDVKVLQELQLTWKAKVFAVMVR